MKGRRIPYSPEPVPNDPAQLRRYLDTELNRIASALQMMASLHLDPAAAAPAKAVRGDIAYADGANWDPGGGEGFYYLNSQGLWKPL